VPSDFCSHCGVRQLCDSYWSANETEPLRWRVAQIEQASKDEWKDLEIELSDCIVTENLIQTSFVSHDGKPVKLRCIIPAKYMSAKNNQDTTLRLISVLLKRQDGQLRVVWGSRSEAYWK